MVSFSFMQKEEKLRKTRKFAHSYLVNGMHNFLQIWYAVSPSGRANPLHIFVSIG